MRRSILLLVLLAAGGCAGLIKAARPARTGQFPMPSLIGKTKGQAEDTLAVEGKTGGLDVQVTDCKDEAVKEGTICEQTPEPGQTTQAGGPTVVYIQGKRDARMPDVVGKTVEEAKKILAEAGFTVVEVRTLETPRAGCVPKRICVTSPEAGVRAHPTVPKSLFLPPDDDQPPVHATTDGKPDQPGDDQGDKPKDEKPKDEEKPKDIF